MANNGPSNNPQNPASSAQAQEQANKTAAGALKEGDGAGSSVTTVVKPQKTAEELEQELAKVQKSYQEAQGLMTRATQDRADLQRRFDTLTDKQEEMARSIADLSSEPHDPAKFMADLEAQGPKFLRTHFQGVIDRNQTVNKKVIDDINGRLLNSEVKNEVLRMTLDEEHYPDFKVLYPEMCELIEKGHPYDQEKPVHEIIDGLYNHVKSSHSEDVLKETTAQAKRDAEENAAREAQATVTGGGKPGAPSEPDLNGMSLEEIEKHAIAVHGPVADEYER